MKDVPGFPDDRILDDEHGLGVHLGDTLSPGAATAVAAAAKWGKYYLYLLLAYFVLLFGFQLFTFGSIAATGGEAAVDLLSLFPFIFVSLLLYAYPVIKMWGFTHKAPKALAADSQALFTDAFDNLQSVYKYIAIFTIVILAFYALSIGLAIVGGIAGAALGG